MQSKHATEDRWLQTVIAPEQMARELAEWKEQRDAARQALHEGGAQEKAQREAVRVMKRVQKLEEASRQKEEGLAGVYKGAKTVGGHREDEWRRKRLQATGHSNTQQPKRHQRKCAIANRRQLRI
ncbi:hypothetical protein EYZ11_010956 [Aspergillus tanneri]|nr:hypothetical protein EYZ11_010956 [Aspergillus tanneri]